MVSRNKVVIAVRAASTIAPSLNKTIRPTLSKVIDVSDFTKSHISKSDDWRTPKEVYDTLDAEFHFNDDPCPIQGNGGLERDWGTSVFMNPPYSKPTPWVKKAYEESLKGKTVVGLLRGDTSTRWFHDWVWHKAELIFVKGRLKFNGIGRAPFPSIIAIWKPSLQGDVE